MSEKIKYSIEKAYEKYLASNVQDSTLRGNLSKGLSDIVESIDFGGDTILNFQCSIKSDNSEILNVPIDYEAIDKIAKNLGYHGIKIRMSGSFGQSGIKTYEDLVNFRKNSLFRTSNKEAKERYKTDFEKLLLRKHPNKFGKSSAKVLVEHLKSKGILNYYQDS